MNEMLGEVEMVVRSSYLDVELENDKINDG